MKLVFGRGVDAVDVRVDDRTGHWTYAVKRAAVILTAPTTSSDVGISVVGDHLADGTTRTCGPSLQILYDAVYGAGLTRAVGNATIQAPDDAFTDPPATCPVPFAYAKTTRAAEPRLPSSGATGSVFVKVSLDENSNIIDTSIYRSPSATLNASALESARHSTFVTTQFRCVGLAMDFLFVVTYNSAR